MESPESRNVSSQMALPLPGGANHANGITIPSDEASVTGSNDLSYNANPGLGSSKGHPSFSVFSEPLARFDRLSLLGRNEGSTSSDEHVADDPIFSMNKNISVLSTSKLANQNMPKTNTGPNTPAVLDRYPMDRLLARLSEQQAILVQQNEALKSGDGDCLHHGILEHASSSSSLPVTPATDAFLGTAPSTRPASARVNESASDNDEVLRLKLQLAQAQTQISKLDHQLAQTRTTKGTPEPQAVNAQRGIHNAKPRDSAWTSPDDTQSDTSDALSTAAFNNSQRIWGNPKAPNVHASTLDTSMNNWTANRAFSQASVDVNGSYGLTDGYRNRLTPESDMLNRPAAGRRGPRYDQRTHPNSPYNSGYSGFSGYSNTMNYEPMSGSVSVPGPPISMPQGPPPMGMGMYAAYQQQPVGTPLSPHASEFTSRTSWKNEVRSTIEMDWISVIMANNSKAMAPEGPTYLPPTEPLNYRRLLDRNVNCNWKYIVDKIVCNNDQQASIFLQQKLKVGTPEQKYEIVEAIVAQAYPLMVNRFGNFLVQRCFEHGTPEQVIKIAEAIRGSTLSLSMDPFGCHVVQKAFDSVPEEYKAIMVHELLRRIPDTVIHRYACHVWQKLFELRWTESPPQIMKYVNEALRGMWHERPCIEEVLHNIDIVAHGQFGNWCIQHICEHGAPGDRSRAVDHVIRYAAEYSTDQFASKVVKKCLKIGGSDFLGRYLDRVCEGRRDRTRIPLIDIASDQYGNYLIQWILNNATSQHREIVASHIRKHMVSLRGSKFGSRVGMLCTNHAVTTRPGPGVGPNISGRMGPPARYGPSYR
ncbi:hypothetical protein S40288_05043 [Stachybotrys chartarum IBT 40288]|nr:hypothetical protein S40288_05043 [Stachybotrys chartarum IBT 40288]